MSYSLALGRADLFPDLPVTLTGFKPQIDATPWLIARLTHTLNETGYITILDLEVRGDPASQRHHFRGRRYAHFSANHLTHVSARLDGILNPKEEDSAHFCHTAVPAEPADCS